MMCLLLLERVADDVFVVCCWREWLTMCLLLVVGESGWRCVCCLLLERVADDVFVVCCWREWLTMCLLFVVGESG